jgi:large subunit ribosomal protein LX
MKVFRVKGEFLMGDRWQTFTKEVVGKDEDAVAEQVYSRLGSKHRVPRSRIQIKDVAEIKGNEITDQVALYKFKNVKGDKDE